MALYMLQVKTVSRRAGGGGSIVAGAAYRAGERLREHEHARSAVAASAHLAGAELDDERGGVVHDFRGKAVEHAEVILPPGAPEAFYDREVLWNQVEAAEKRVDARVGRELVVALPRELDDAANRELTRAFVAESLVGRGMCADFAIHAPTASDGLCQPHAHILVNTREVGPDGFGRKVREWDRRELVTSLRSEWSACCNHALEHAGREERVDHRSLADQLAEALEQGDFARAAEVDRLPGVHLGPAVAAMEREGVRTDIGNELRAIEETNRERGEVYALVRAVEEDVPGAAAEFMQARAASTDPVEASASWSEWAHDALGHVRELLAREVVESVRELARDALERGREMVADVADWFAGLDRVDDTELRLAREEVREREVAQEEREIAEVVRVLDAREQEREAVREVVLERAPEREEHGLELGG